MESLKLEKFKDYSLSNLQKEQCFGGAMSKDKHVSIYFTSLGVQDRETDIWADCDDNGCYELIDSNVEIGVWVYGDKP